MSHVRSKPLIGFLKEFTPQFRSIRSKLSLSMFIGAAVGLFLALSIFGTMRELSVAQEKLHRHPYSVGIALRDIRTDVEIMRSELATLAAAPSPLRLRRFERRSNAIDNRVLSQLALVQERFLGRSELPDKAVAYFDDWRPVRRQIVALVREGDQIAAYTLAKTDGARQLGFLLDSLDALIRDAATRAQSFRDSNRRLWQEALLIQAASFLFAFLAMIGALRYVGRAVVTPTEEISKAIQKVSAGELDADVPHATRPDEIGEIARSAKVFLDTSLAIRNSKFDVLTGLPQRAQICKHLEALRADPTMAGRTASLLHIDIDGFSQLNDSLGRETGDKILVKTAAILRECSRVGELVARDGADSFVMLLLGHSTEHELTEAAVKIRDRLESLSKSVVSSSSALRVSCSIGAVICDDLSTPENMLVNAEKALAEARKSGAGAIEVYTAEMDARLQRHRYILQGLKFALEHGEIAPFYQPQVGAKDGELVGFEALVRWNHPEQGVLSPWQFVDIASSAGLLSDITDSMIAQTVSQLATWRSMGFRVPRISLNCAASDLSRPDFVDRLLLHLEGSGLAPDDICIELLESAMIEEEEDPVTRTLARLAQLGFPIELDDFGTGHAAISTLHLVKLNGIKIDRSFVTRLHERPEQQHLTRGILRISKALSIATVAEGVECNAERAILVALGCEAIQGFCIARPMPAYDTTVWLQTFKPQAFEPSWRESA